MDWIKTNRYTALAVFVIAFIIYTLTMSPTVSLWDCGEFLACSYKLEVPHPPGAPLFLLVGRIFSMLPIATDIAYRINFISVISSALTIMFLYLSIVLIMREWHGKLETSSEWLSAIFSGLIGAFTFAFTHSFWFNAVEAEVYAASMLFTALMVWLVLKWSERADEPGSYKYILMISYLIGLAIGVHLLNVLALPFITLIIYYRKFQPSLKRFLIVTVLTGVIMLAVYPGVVKYLPLIPLINKDMGGLLLGLVFIVILYLAYWSVKNNKKLYGYIFASLLLIVVGYSSYASIFIRSGLNPDIDENNPETLEKFLSYLNREQYGDQSIFDRSAALKNSEKRHLYKSTSEFFWKYQINKMYNRYFLWQFVGLSDNERDVDMSKFFAIPLIFGLLGLYWHFNRDPKRAMAVLALFVMTGLAIVIYVNQPDPQPRERDYSYVGSFFAFSIWVGLGFNGIIELIKNSLFKKNVDKLEFSSSLGIIVFAVMLIAGPVNMLAKNYHNHNRSGRYVAWDYPYNMLMSCQPNAILFTNGDNDTFPVWYLQEVEGVRKDVRIVNLSLLNTDWYVKQLRDLKPKVPMRMSDLELKRLGLRQWKTQKVTIKVPAKTANMELSLYNAEFGPKNIQPAKEIKFEVRPALTVPDARGNRVPVLRTQDYMILNILVSNRWQRPVYFAVTVPTSNMLSELMQYMRMDGLVQKIVPYKNWRTSPTYLKKNLLEVYKYRGLDNPHVYYDKTVRNMLQNYRTGFTQLARYYIHKGNREEARKVLEYMDKKISPEVISWNNSPMYLRAVKNALWISADTTLVDSILKNVKNDREFQTIGEELLRMGQFGEASKVLKLAYENNPANARTLGLLINSYDLSGQKRKSIEPLERWVSENPSDKQAKNLLESLKKDSAK